jgi:hypothetical protein
MKTTTKNKTKTKQPQVEHSKESFIASLQRPDGANNSIVEKFLAIMEQLTKNQAHFTYQDALYYGKGFELDANEVKDLFTRWTDRETQLGNLERVDGCYNFPVFTVISTKSFAQSSVI